jgi:predicted neuraminidase
VKTALKRMLHSAILFGALPAFCLAGRGGQGLPARRIKPVTSEFIFTRAPFKECHASTLVELPEGQLLAAWFGGAREGDKSVAIWGARKAAGSWSSPEVLASEPGVPCWNPVLFRDRDGLLWLFYKVGSSPETWTGAYRTSPDGRAWSETTYLPAGLLGPIKNKPIFLANGDILAGTSVESYDAWACWVEVSSDRGRTWKKYGPITVPGQRYGIIQPTVWEVTPGQLKMLVRATERIGSICAATSADGGRTWSPAQPTTLPNPNSGIDAVKMADGTVALVYNHAASGRSPLNIAFSRDNADSWSEPFILEDGPGEYSYPAIIQTRDGMLHITYTWRRQRIKHVVIDPKAVFSPAAESR